MNPYIIPDDDRELDLRELLHYCLHHWFPMIIVGILLACLLDGAYYVKNRPASGNTELQTEAAKEESEAEEKLITYEAQSELYQYSLDTLGGDIRSENEYLQNSTLMKIDPYNTPTARSSIFITTKASDKSAAITAVKEMQTELLEGAYLEALAKETGVQKVPYIRELISVKIESLDSTIVNMSGENEAGKTSDSTSPQAVDVQMDDEDGKTISAVRYQITIKTVGEDIDQAKKILRGILEEGEEYGEELKQKYKFSLQKGVVRTYYSNDAEVKSARNLFINEAEWTTKKKATAESDQAALGKPAIKEETEGTSASSASAVSKQKILAYGIIGFIVGIFLMIVFYCLKFVMNDTLLSYRDFCSRFIVRDLGSYDKTVHSVSMIDANIRNYAPNTKKVVLVGTVANAVMEELCSSLQSSDQTYEVCIGGNILTTPDARLKLTKADAVVLAEKAGTSRYSEIARETEILSNAEKNIVGIVVC